MMIMMILEMKMIIVQKYIILFKKIVIQMNLEMHVIIVLL